MLVLMNNRVSLRGVLAERGTMLWYVTLIIARDIHVMCLFPIDERGLFIKNCNSCQAESKNDGKGQPLIK
jgi:hypothetical protein